MEKTNENHHTPGPWNTGTVETNETRYFQPIFAETGQCLGVVYGEINHKWTDEHRQNACLMAAAPDLLRELKSAREMIASAMENDDPLWFTQQEAALLDPIDEAIAKAEGR